jgi:hypothetical protein
LKEEQKSATCAFLPMALGPHVIGSGEVFFFPGQSGRAQNNCFLLHLPRWRMDDGAREVGMEVREEAAAAFWNREEEERRWREGERERGWCCHL